MFQSDHDSPGGTISLIPRDALGYKNPIISHDGPAAKIL